jgi:hypothetical protein
MSPFIVSAISFFFCLACLEIGGKTSVLLDLVMNLTLRSGMEGSAMTFFSSALIAFSFAPIL